jgi:HSP20 family protein
LIKIKVCGAIRWYPLTKSIVKEEFLMVEKSHTAGWWPSLYEPLRQVGEKVADWFAPRSDASASRDAYRINVELPGVKEEDIEVGVEGNTVTVKGEKKSEREESGDSYFFSEREFGAFFRSFRLPPDADLDRIEAHFSNGILSLQIAKLSKQGPGERKIKINRTE